MPYESYAKLSSSSNITIQFVANQPKCILGNFTLGKHKNFRLENNFLVYDGNKTDDFQILVTFSLIPSTTNGELQSYVNVNDCKLPQLGFNSVPSNTGSKQLQQVVVSDIITLKKHDKVSLAGMLKGGNQLLYVNLCLTITALN